MGTRELVKSVLRTRVLEIHPMVPGYDEPLAKKKSYLIMGDDLDIQDFTRLVELGWPIRHYGYLI